MKILGICGSLRAASYNRSLLDAAIERAPSGMNFELADISRIPLYDQDLEAAGWPEAVAVFKDQISRSDGLIIATPEYNYSVPGVLKNAIDWASRPPRESPLGRKPIGLMGASMGLGATIRSQLHLRQVFVFTNSPVMLQPELLVPRAQEKFDQEGKLTDETTRAFLGKFMEAYRDFVERAYT